MTEAEISGSKELISQRAKAAAQSSSGSKRPVEEGRLQVQVPKKSRTVAKVRMCHASEDKMPGCLPMTLVTTSSGTGHQLGTARQLFPQASSPISGVSTTDPLLLEGGCKSKTPVTKQNIQGSFQRHQTQIHCCQRGCKSKPPFRTCKDHLQMLFLSARCVLSSSNIRSKYT